MPQAAQLFRALIAAQQHAGGFAGPDDIAAHRFGVGVRSIDHPAGPVSLQPGDHLLQLETPAAHLAANVSRQLLAGGRRHRQGVFNLRRVKLLAQRPRVAGSAHHQHLAVAHST